MENELKMLRLAMDSIDARIVELLAIRFAHVRRVGEIKAEIGEPPVSEARQRERELLLGKLAEAHGVDAGLLTEIYEAIRKQNVASHQRIASGSKPATAASQGLSSRFPSWGARGEDTEPSATGG